MAHIIVTKAVYRENKYNKLTGTFGLLPTHLIQKIIPITNDVNCTHLQM